MLCLDAEVRTALISDAPIISILGGQKVYQPSQPGNKDNQFPAIVFEEISNVPDFAADDQEAASRITYRLLIYVKETSITPLLNAVENVMLRIDFTRHSSRNLHDLPPGVRGKEILFITVREC